MVSSPDGAEPLSVGRAIRAIRRCDMSASSSFCSQLGCLPFDPLTAGALGAFTVSENMKCCHVQQSIVRGCASLKLSATEQI